MTWGLTSAQRCVPISSGEPDREQKNRKTGAKLPVVIIVENEGRTEQTQEKDHTSTGI